MRKPPHERQAFIVGLPQGGLALPPSKHRQTIAQTLYGSLPRKGNLSVLSSLGQSARRPSTRRSSHHNRSSQRPGRPASGTPTQAPVDTVETNGACCITVVHVGRLKSQGVSEIQKAVHTCSIVMKATQCHQACEHSPSDTALVTCAA